MNFWEGMAKRNKKEDAYKELVRAALTLEVELFPDHIAATHVEQKFIDAVEEVRACT